MCRKAGTPPGRVTSVGARGGDHDSLGTSISPRSDDARRAAGADDPPGSSVHLRRRIAVAQQTVVGSERTTYTEQERGSGWITFAGVVIVMVSVLNMIDGIAAISKSSFFVADARYVISDLNTWGWIVLGLGVIQMIVAFGIWAGNQLARWTGIVIVSLNAIAQLLFIPAYPFWSLSIFTLDLLVLYGLAAHGGRPALN
jgi:hypothetical protein